MENQNEKELTIGCMVMVDNKIGRITYIQPNRRMARVRFSLEKCQLCFVSDISKTNLKKDVYVN